MTDIRRKRQPQPIPRLRFVAHSVVRNGLGGLTHSDIDTKARTLFPEKIPHG